MIRTVLYFLRWQLYPVALALPAHLAFIRRGGGSTRAPTRRRLSLAARCMLIHLRVRCGHNPAEALHIVEEILELPPDVPGVVVECGSFLGGSTAKLSHAAALSGRQLIVCDSFEGLPGVASTDHDVQKPDFQAGEYRGRLDLVTRNVRKFGRLECVRFVPGWYEASLAQLAGTPIATAFWDVDLQASFLTCIQALWREVQPGSKVFLHDVDRAPVVAVFTDAAWWRTVLGSEPPQFVGANTGLDRASPLLGYVVKR